MLDDAQPDVIEGDRIFALADNASRRPQRLAELLTQLTETEARDPMAPTTFPLVEGVARGGVEPPTYRFSGGRSYQLSYLAGTGVTPDNRGATQTGLEPATFAVTGRRANQLRHWALLFNMVDLVKRTPNGIRTRVAALKGRSPRPLDDGDVDCRSGPRVTDCPLGARQA